MDRPRAQTVNLSEITAVGSENSMAIMEMVKEGEMTLDEAIASVKNMTSKSKESGFNRRGGMKKFRGRLDLEVRFQKASAFSVLILDLKKGRDLMQVTSSQNTNPVVKVYISGGDKKQAKSKETDTHKGVVHPSFNDQFTWEFKTDQRKGGMRLHIVVENREKGLLRQKKKIIGAMSFSIDSIWKAESPISGWFRLLDETRGANMNVPYKHHKPIIAPVVSPTNSAGVAAAAASATLGRKASLADRPLPAPPQLAGDSASGRKNMPLPPPPSDAGADIPPAVRPYRPSTVSVPSQNRAHDGNPFGVSSLPDTQEQANPFLDDADEDTSNPFGAQSSQRRSATVSDTSRVPKTKQPTEKIVVKKITVDSFQYLKVLGQGSFGKVMLAEHKDTKDMVAIKVIKKEPVIEDDDVEATMTERRVLALSAGNPFLTGLHATFQTGDKLFYVMELISGGDLMFHIQNDKVFEIPRARFYAAEICLGLWYLHDHKVLYRDLKLDNVMLSATGHVKIADFGMCKENIPKGGRTSTFCGTPGYLAPEIIQEKPYGASVDWWALGVLMYEMMIGDSPFEADDDDELFHIICHSKPDVRSLPQSARDVVNGFLTKSPSKRYACVCNRMRSCSVQCFAIDTQLFEALQHYSSRLNFLAVVCGHPQVSNRRNHVVIVYGKDIDDGVGFLKWSKYAQHTIFFRQTMHDILLPHSEYYTFACLFVTLFIRL
eukprot:m.529028 g.529028  ORF g.529028 m.529028 type:complete len:716 (-) comp22016_c0_seq1:1266-3413(-)